MKRKNNLIRNLFIGPVIIYATLLIALPIIYILVISFYKNDSYGGFIRTLSILASSINSVLSKQLH